MVIARYFILVFFGLVVVTHAAHAQEQWPREIETPEAKITLYQPTPETFSGDKLSGRAAVSVTPKSKDPVFGAIWLDARVATDRTERIVTLNNVTVSNVKFPQAVDSTTIKKFKTLLETEIAKWDLEISLDDLLATLELTAQEKDVNDNFKMEAPEIVIAEVPSVLVMIDGEPKFEKIADTKLERVLNSPYFIVKDKDGKYYLNVNEKWYTTSAILGDWKVTSYPPKEVKKQEAKFSEDKPPVSEAEKAIAQTESKKAEPINIVIRTAPAELITTKGASVFTPIQGTQLLYVTNTKSHVFMNIATQENFVLISGRWYSAKSLKGPWTFVASDKLPADFAKIPEGSEKDIVLASVAGTPAAKEALLDAQVPQTAAVDRKTAKVEVKYDGEPKFEKIEGTTLSYAVNTSSSVILSESTYYVCDNAVWFSGKTAGGPWTVSTEVPKDVQKIPPSSPVYNVKYVYVYDSTPDVVYVGYTPGYVGSYAYGPTVIYGTGYYYNPWYGPYYYPHPMTYGMAMSYNPYMGWSIGVSVHIGGPYYGGGYYGPPMYHPPYYAHHHHYYGGGGNNVIINNGNINNINRGDNIYNNRPGGIRPSTRPATGQGNAGIGASQRPSNLPANGGAQRPSTQPATAGPRNNNNVMTDRSGNVYQKQGQEWQQNNGRDWQPAQQNNRDINNMQTNHDRGMQRTNNAMQMGGGGARMGGGMGGGGRRR